MSYFQKSLLNALAVLGHLPKLKRGLGLAFEAQFTAYFFRKHVPCLILYQLTKFQYFTYFPAKDFKYVFLNSSLANWWRGKLSDLSLANLLTNEWHEEKEGKRKIPKIEYLENESSFKSDCRF